MKPNKPKEKAHIVKNVSYMLRLAFRCSPMYILSLYVAYVLSNVYESVVMGVIFLKTALSIIEDGLDFKVFAQTVILIVAGKIMIDLLDKFLDFYGNTNFAIRFEQAVNNLLFKKAQEVELACYEDPDFFDKYTRATWVIEKYANVNIVCGSAWVFGSAVSMIALVIYLVSVDPVMLFFVVSPVIVMIFQTLRNRTEYEKEKEMTPYERKKDYVKRTVLLKDFAKEIKTTDIFTVLKTHFDKAVQKNIAVIKKYGIRIAVYELLSDLFGTILPVGGGFIYVCWRLVGEKNLDISDFAVLLSAIMAARRKMNHFSGYLSRMQNRCFWVQSMRDFLAYEPKIKSGDKIPHDFESLEFRNVSFSYNAEKTVMKNVSFKINKGETIAVVGHNGAGKTTFSKLLMRLYDVTDGEILYNGINIKEYDLAEYRKKFASVFQDYKIFAMTAAENILMQETDENSVKIAEHAIQLAGAGEKFKTFPDGVNTLMTKEFDDNGASLSGGEAQKLAISRLFARDYDIAVLDEPSSALDPVAESKMYENLKKGTAGKTVVYISHRLSSAADADNILVFSDGRLIESGSHGDLMAAGGEYAEMFTLQASGYREECDTNA